MSTVRSSNSWAAYLPFLMGIGLAMPVYEQVQKVLQPSIGTMSAFAAAVLAAFVVASPAFLAVNWMIQREQSGKTEGLAPMVYRPAAIPLCVFISAFIKNFPEAPTEYIVWAYLIWLLILLAGAVALQRRRGRPWSWRIAVLVGVVLALVALPAAGFVVGLVAPEAMQPRL